MIHISTGVDIAHLNPVFWGKVQQWLATIPFDVLIESAYRSLEKQAELRKAWEEDPENNRPANKPGESAHNYGLAVDVHPIPATKHGYWVLAKTCKAFGITGIGSEAWHFQDPSWREKIPTQLAS